MSKALIVLMVGMLAVGCATLTPEEKQQKALRDSVVGEYERKNGNGDTFKYVYLENGVCEVYYNSNKRAALQWSISNGKIHVKHDPALISVWRINNQIIICNLSGRGDKDVAQVAEKQEME